MKGKWITCAASVETPMFRKTFAARAVKKAVIDVCGLGYFTLLVNGRRVTEDLFTPAFTNYGPRDLSAFHYPLYDTLSCRVLYLEYDVAPFLREGENTVDIIVGNGWYRQRERVCECREVYGESLVAAFDLKLTHETGEETVISTDGSEQGFVYPILKSNLFLGEEIDTRLFDAPLEETPVFIADLEPEQLCRQTCPPDRVVRTLTPRFLGEAQGRRVYDAGENISGTVSLRARGRRGAALTLRFAEVLTADGELDPASTGASYTCASGRPQIQTDTFILNGREQELDVMFVFHGFRYFDIEGEAELFDVRVNVIHTDLKVSSGFTSDNGMLNWLYDAYIRTQLNNIHGCIPSDCPHRERLGYTGDGQCCAPAALLTLDAAEMYRKWVDDILDAQDVQSGHVQHTAPLMGGGGGPGGWGCAVVMVPWALYQHTGDKTLLRHTFPAMKRWLSYMMVHCEDGLLTSEEEGGWCLGDWAAPDLQGLQGDQARPAWAGKARMIVPEAFVNTCYLIKSLEIMSAMAREMDDMIWHELYGMADEYRTAVYKRYFDGAHYCAGHQGADAFAMWADLPESGKLFEGLCAYYEALGTFDTGFLGTDILCEVLFENRRGDLALRLMASENASCGFNFMRSRGATTLYEYLDSESASLDHPMFGACVRQLFHGLLGIRQRQGTCGYRDLVIEPWLKGPVGQAAGHITVPAGRVEVRFSLGDKRLVVDVPAGIRAVCRIGEVEYPLNVGKNEFPL